MAEDDATPPVPEHPPVDGPVYAADPAYTAAAGPDAGGPDSSGGGWRWRSTVTGAIAGGVLAAAVAVPVTWALADRVTPSDTSSSAVPMAPGGLGGSDGSGTEVLPPWGTDPGGSGGDQPGQDPATATGATAAESRGVLLVDSTLTDGEAAGTGLVIDSSGLALTNYHVVEGATSVSVTVASTGATYDARVVGFDRRADVALLQLDGASGLATVHLDDDGDPAVSDPVTAVGNAEGQGSLSASSGRVVSLHQSITTQDSALTTGEHLTGLIRTDAYVVGGYSGGALLDGQGEVVGITTAASGAGAAESYAVPIDSAMRIADQIEAGHETAQVQIGPSPYLGIGVRDATTGLTVGRVEPGAAADRAGVVAGDTVTSLGGRSVSSLDRLRAALATHEPGDRVTLGWTDTSGSAHRATVTLGSSPIA